MCSCVILTSTMVWSDVGVCGQRDWVPNRLRCHGSPVSFGTTCGTRWDWLHSWSRLFFSRSSCDTTYCLQGRDTFGNHSLRHCPDESLLERIDSRNHTIRRGCTEHGHLQHRDAFHESVWKCDLIGGVSPAPPCSCAARGTFWRSNARICTQRREIFSGRPRVLNCASGFGDRAV